MRGGWGGWSILEFSNAWGGSKISMPPVVGVRIFSGTTHSGKSRPFKIQSECAKYFCHEIISYNS